jgi:hypothetical protein
MKSEVRVTDKRLDAWASWAEQAPFLEIASCLRELQRLRAVVAGVREWLLSIDSEEDEHNSYSEALLDAANEIRAIIEGPAPAQSPEKEVEPHHED